MRHSVSLCAKPGSLPEAVRSRTCPCIVVDATHAHRVKSPLRLGAFGKTALMDELLRRLFAVMYFVGLLGGLVGVGWLCAHPQSRQSRWIRRNMFESIITLYVAWSERRARRRLGNACRNLPPSFPSVPWHEWRYVATPVRRWCAVAPWAAVAHIFQLVVLAAALLNVGTLVNVVRYAWLNPPGSKGPRHLTGDHLVDDVLSRSANDSAEKRGKAP